MDALTSVMDLETYDITDLVDVSVELEKEPRATTSNVYLDMLNNLDLKMNRKYRKEKDKIEYTYFIKGQVNPFQLDLTIPVLEDRKNNVAYMNIDSVVDNLGPILGLTEDYKGKIVEMDISDVASVVHQDINLKTFQQYLKDSILQIIKEKGEDSFYNDGKHFYAVQLTKEDLKDLYFDIMLRVENDANPESATTSEEILAFIETEVNSMFENFEVDKFKLIAKVDGEELQEIMLDADVSIQNIQIGEIKVSVAMKEIYNSLNKPVQFSIDPTTADLMPLEEFEDLIY